MAAGTCAVAGIIQEVDGVAHACAATIALPSAINISTMCGSVLRRLSILSRAVTGNDHARRGGAPDRTAGRQACQLYQKRVVTAPSSPGKFMVDYVAPVPARSAAADLM
jgi:hypothetical protein